MLLITHIIIALASIMVATGLTVKPSINLFRINTALIIGTLATGSGLILHGAAVLATCLSGLVYLACVLALTTLAAKKLARVHVTND